MGRKRDSEGKEGAYQRRMGGEYNHSISHTHILHISKLGVVVHAFNPSTRRQRKEELCETEASFNYIVNSRQAAATGQPCLKQQRLKKKNLSLLPRMFKEF